MTADTDTVTDPNKYKEQHCKQCGALFTARLRSYCSSHCRLQAQYTTTKAKRRAERAAKKAALQPRPCDCCGTIFTPDHTHPGIRNCSLACTKVYNTWGKPINGQTTLNKILAACGLPTVDYGDVPIVLESIRYKAAE